MNCREAPGYDGQGTGFERPMRVFVHLAHGFGAREWQKRWSEGKVFGINEPLPYGYFRANKLGCVVEYSEDKSETILVTLFRLGVRAIFGFDLIHAWRNFDGIRKANVVWTHTESQYVEEQKANYLCQLCNKLSQLAELTLTCYSWHNCHNNLGISSGG